MRFCFNFHNQKFRLAADHKIEHRLIQMPLHVHADCESSLSGIFYGLLFLIVTIVCIILVFVGFQNRYECIGILSKLAKKPFRISLIQIIFDGEHCDRSALSSQCAVYTHHSNNNCLRSNLKFGHKSGYHSGIG